MGERDVRIAEVTCTTFAGGAPDAEVQGIMEELDRLQTWTVLLTARSNPVPGAREAMDLIQRTRCLIVERLYPNATPHSTGGR